MSLLKECVVPVCLWPRELYVERRRFRTEPFVQKYTSGQMFIISKYLFRQFVDKLIETEVDLRLDLIVKELFLEFG